MAELSQYPAAEELAEEVIETKSLLVSLQTVALFADLQQIKTRDGLPIFVPTAIGSNPFSVSTSVVSKTLAENTGRSFSFGSGGYIRQSFLVAARATGAQLGANNEPPNCYPRDMLDLINGSCDAGSRMPVFNMFDRATPRLTVLRSRSLEIEDLVRLRDVIEDGSQKLGMAVEGGIDSDCPITRFTELVLLVQRLIEKGASYEDMFAAFSRSCNAERSRFQSSLIGRSVLGRMQLEQDGVEREKAYYLALSGLFSELTPAFISPVGSTNEVLAEMMLAGGLVASSGARQPHLKLDPRLGKDEGRSAGEGMMSEEHEKVVVSMIGPGECSREGLQKAVVHLCQKTICMVSSAGTEALKLKDTHR
jgi:hypothetical protein